MIFGQASVATYAEARLLPGINTGDRLQVLGRTTQSDGGQGLFTWVAGGSTTANDGYELTAPGGIWRRTNGTTVDLLMFGSGGAYDGTTDCTAAWNAAVTAIGSTVATLVISGPAAFASTPSTLPSNVIVSFIGAGKLLPAVTKVVTIQGPIVAASTQFIFGGAGSFAWSSSSRQRRFYPGWFGGVADNATESYAALQACNVAASAVQGEVRLDSGSYLFSTTLNILNNTKWIGTGADFGTQLSPQGTAQIALLGAQNGGSAVRIYIGALTVVQTNCSASQVININAAYSIELDDIFVYDVPTNKQGIYQTHTKAVVIKNCRVLSTHSTGQGIYCDDDCLDTAMFAPDTEGFTYGIYVTGTSSVDIFGMYSEAGGGAYVNVSGANSSVNFFGGYMEVPNSSFDGIYYDTAASNVSVYGTAFKLLSSAKGIHCFASAASNLNVYNVPVASITDVNNRIRKYTLEPLQGDGIYGTTGCLAATFDRTLPTSITAGAAASGTLRLYRIVLPAGLVINNIKFWSGSTALGTGTHQWFGLFDSARTVLALTADDTSTAWAANTAKSLALSAAYTTLTAGVYYVGILITATTVPTIEASVAAQATGARNAAPSLGGDSTVGLTTPASCTGVQTAITTLAQIAYAELS